MQDLQLAHGNAARVSRPNPSSLDFAPELLGLAPDYNVTGLTLENQIAWKTASEIIKLKHFLHVHDVVTDWSSALAGFLVSVLFGVSPGQSYQFFHIANVFLSGFIHILHCLS